MKSRRRPSPLDFGRKRGGMGGARAAYGAIMVAASLSLVGTRLVAAESGPAPGVGEADPAVRKLAAEVATKGWILFSARSEAGDWDLYRCRPDGALRQRVTQTPEDNEFAPQFSRDGRRVLYRRVPRAETIDGNHYGAQGVLMIARSDGSQAVAFGGPGEFPWASWSPDGKMLACLDIKGISLVELETHRVVRRLDRKGFFQQLTWSPDGAYLCGVANSYGTGWSIARIEIASGQAQAVNRVDCCTPDWFPDSRDLIFSWRPPGQKTNQGYGWTQLWRADAEGRSRQLVFGEDGRHVYGGQVSPDGRYVLFTGNLRENGDPELAGAPMGLMRLEDAPVIQGPSPALRALHPEAKNGPVLTLPIGWEPAWTFSELAASAQANASSRGSSVAPPASEPAAVSELASEVHALGWVVFSAPSSAGDWDLFLIRPDGSERRHLTSTPEFNEAGARFSPDGRRLLYYRLPKSEAVDNNTYGTYDLVLADADGANAVVYGRGFPWATWGPDGEQLACLTLKEIAIVDVNSRQVQRRFPRHGIVQQLVWSPDGQWLTGTANGLGPAWNIARLNLRTGEVNAVSETERYNCTPDWAPNSQQIVYARGIVPTQPGWAEFWVGDGDGAHQQMLYAEEGRHIYGALVSPDGEYLMFTRSVKDLGQVGPSQTTMALIRRRDAPMVGAPSESLRRRFPRATTGPRLDLGPGWEPHWIGALKSKGSKP